MMPRNKNINVEKTRKTFNDLISRTSSLTLKRMMPAPTKMSRSKQRRTSSSRSPTNIGDVEGEGNYFIICIY